MCLDCMIPISGLLKPPPIIDGPEPIHFFLTGLSSAGKTTIVRQLFLLCNQKSKYKFCNHLWEEESFPIADNKLWQTIIRKNILDAMYIFIRQLELNNEEFDSEEDEEFAKMIEEICKTEIEDLGVTPDFTQHLLRLFQSRAIQNIWKRRNKIKIEGRTLFDGCDHFLSVEKISEVFNSEYKVSDKDKSHSRKPTTMMQNYRFKINDTRLIITDVGGEKQERMKMLGHLQSWSYTASTNHFILLVVSMSDFNVQDDESDDPKDTLLDKSIGFMEALLNNEIAQNSGLFIFFNKTDRFKEKLMDLECREDIKYLAPFITPYQLNKYQKCGRFNESAMQNAIFTKFKDAIESLGERKYNTYSKFTCAVDSRMMEGLFSALQNEKIDDFLLEF